MAGARVERRLAAILAADVAGYSRLMGVDEEGTSPRSRRAAANSSILRSPSIAAVSSRPRATVRCRVCQRSRCRALRHGNPARHGGTQRRHSRRSPDRVPYRHQRRRHHHRRGRHLRRWGQYRRASGVAGQPRRDLPFRNAYQQIKGKLALDVSDMGEQQLKNIAQPVRVYSVRLDGTRERPALALPDKPSIAVLPFQNMSGDPEQEYFADGMAEDIITGLSRSAGSSSSRAIRRSPTRARQST